MTKHKKNFETVFCADKDWQANACVGWSHDPLHLYVRGYKRAGDLLVEIVLNSNRDQDILIYPIAFLYRQYIELLLKEIIIAGRKFLKESVKESDKPLTDHKIDILWDKAKKISMKIFKDEDDPLNFERSENILMDFSRIDSGSFSFRYPKTKKGKKTLEGLTHINIRRLAEHIEALSIDLENISDGIAYKNEGRQQNEGRSQNEGPE